MMIDDVVAVFDRNSDGFPEEGDKRYCDEYGKLTYSHIIIIILFIREIFYVGDGNVTVLDISIFSRRGYSSVNEKRL